MFTTSGCHGSRPPLPLGSWAALDPICDWIGEGWGRSHTLVGHAITMDATQQWIARMATNPVHQNMEMVHLIAEQIADGTRQAAIISGPSGVGKTFAFETAFRRKGLKFRALRPASAAALIADLCANPSGIFLFDECDYMFNNVDMLNVLKIVTDTKSGPRLLSHTARTSGRSISETKIRARCVFLTNIDLQDKKLLSNKRIGPHLAAITSRCPPYVVASDHEKIWEYTVYLAIEKRILAQLGSSRNDTDLALKYFTETMYQTRDVSPRRLALIAREIMRSPKAWRDLLAPTLLPSPWSDASIPPIPQLPPKKAMMPPPLTATTPTPTRSQNSGLTASLGKRSGAEEPRAQCKTQVEAKTRTNAPA